MEKKKIVEAYNKYIKSLNDGDSDIIKNFQTMYQWLKANCDDDAWVTLSYGSICKTLKAAEKRELNYRDNSKGLWDGSVAKKGFQLAKTTDRTSKSGNMQKLKDCFIELFTMFNETSCKPPLQLYVCHCYYQTETGKSFFNRVERDADQVIKEFNEEEDEKVAL